MDVRSELLRSSQIAQSLRAITELTARGRLAEARTMCERLLKNNPDDAEVHNLAGVVAISQKRKSEAMQHFQFAVSREPNNVGYLNNLGRFYMKMERVELAIPVFMRITKLDPQYASAVLALGDFFEKMGKADKGMPHIEKYLQTNPDNLEARVMHARMLEAVGRHGDAEESYWRLEAIPETRVLALNRLAFVKKYSAASPLLDRIDAAIAAPGMAPENIGVLSAAAGKILEDLGEYDRAFERYLISAKHGDLQHRSSRTRFRVTRCNCSCSRRNFSLHTRPMEVLQTFRSWLLGCRDQGPL